MKIKLEVEVDTEQRKDEELIQMLLELLEKYRDQNNIQEQE